MKVAKSWLKELIDLKVSDQQVEELLPLRTIALNETTPEYFELDMKGYNRADLLSMRGVAYEIGAITDSPLKFSEPNSIGYIWIDKALPSIDVAVEDEDLSPVYCLAKIEGLKVSPSDNLWVQKLLNSGMRSVNNIADVTNLVMLEYGQPLHSFDASSVADEKIVVRTAKEGEVLETLDQKKRQLTPSDLLITDPQKALGLAGVMGGKNSEITDSTTTILLEAAIFDPITLRKTSARLGLQSEASKRFFHGLTKKRLLQAFDTAIRMYQELGGELTAMTILGDTQDQAKKIPLTLKKIQKIIGIDISEELVETSLKKLHFEISDKLNEESVSWVITPPYYRLDVEIEEDLIEEIARMYGYENIPSHPLEGDIPKKFDQSLYSLIFNLKNSLVEQGFTELQTYSYFSTAVLENFGWLENQNSFPLIRVANPISSETEYLRHNLWSNLIEKAAENLKYFDSVEVFEVGKTYESLRAPLSSGNESLRAPLSSGNNVIEDKIQEEYRLALLAADNTENPLALIYEKLKQIIPADLELGGNVPNPPGTELFHPKRSAVLLYKGQPIGGMAEVHPRLAHAFGIEKRVAIAEIKLKSLI